MKIDVFDYPSFDAPLQRTPANNVAKRSIYDITACAAATSCCISDVPAFSMGEGKFRPPQLPHFSSDLSETQRIKKHVQDTNPHAKFGFIGGIWANTRILAVHSGLPFFVHFAQHPGRTVRPTVTTEGSKRVFLAKELSLHKLDFNNHIPKSRFSDLNIIRTN